MELPAIQLVSIILPILVPVNVRALNESLIIVGLIIPWWDVNMDAA
jgi:hypothetical protein